MSSKTCHHKDGGTPEISRHSQYQQIACQLFGKRVQDFYPDSIDKYDDEEEETEPCRKKRKQDLSIISKTYEAPKRETGPRGRCLVCYSVINQENLTNAQNKQNCSALLDLIKLPSTEQGTSERFSWLLAGSNFTLEKIVCRLSEGAFNCLCLICNSICDEISSKRKTICKLEQEILELQKKTLSVIKVSSELAAAKQSSLITEERDQFVDNVRDIKCHLKSVRMLRKCLIGDGNREDIQSANRTDDMNDQVKSENEADEERLIDWTPSVPVDESEFNDCTCEDALPSDPSDAEEANNDSFSENDANSPVDKPTSSAAPFSLSKLTNDTETTHEEHHWNDHAEDPLETEQEIKEDVDEDTEWEYKDSSASSDSESDSDSEEEKDKRARVSGSGKQKRKLRNGPKYKSDIRGDNQASRQNQVKNVQDKSKPYTCDYCDKSFIKTSCWINHKQMHKDSYPFVCKICTDRFSQQSSLKEHELENSCIVSSKLRWNDKHKCDTCGLVLSTKQNWKVHVQSVHRKVKPIECDQCGRTFALKSYLTRHMLLHTAERRYVCPICSDAFTHLGPLRTHQLKHDNESNGCVCNECSKSFIDELTLKLHMNTVHYERQCELCGTKFQTKAYFARHMKTHLKGKPCACQICPRRFMNTEALKLHMLRKHSDFVTFKTYECNKCKKFFPSPSALEIHAKKHGPKKFQYECEHCGKKYASTTGLQYHISHEHSGTRMPFVCDICSKSFRLNSQLTLHKVVEHNQSHDMDTLFQCADCKKMFPNNTQLQDHRKRAHGSGEHVCEKCSCRFHTETSLITHIKLHCGKTFFVPSKWKEENGIVYFRDMEVCTDDENMLLCPFLSCEKSFQNRQKLSTHFRSCHDEEYKAREKSHQCDQCEMNFTAQYLLINHIKAVHEGGFVCDICGTTRTSKSAVDRHIQRDHEGVRPFVCKHCGKSYFTKTDLDIHERHHTGEKPFACHLCSSTFIRKTNLNIHIRTLHLHLGENPRSKKSKSNKSANNKEVM